MSRRTEDAGRPGWQRAAEAGSVLAMRAMNLFYRVFGRRAARALVLPLAAYFQLRDRAAREASRAYLERLYAFPGGAAALGRAPGRRATLRQLHEFGMQLFDRMVVWGDSLAGLEVDPEGGRPLLELARSGRGGILVGAHLGSFDMLRRIADHYAVVVNVLMYTEHAEQINAFFERLDPNSRVRVLRIDPGSVSTAFAMRRCVERGEFVAILADRVHPAGREHPVRVPFLGTPAQFPRTPFEVGAVLGCPVLMCLCTRTDAGCYESLAVPLWEGGSVPRRERAKAVEQMLNAFVAELERGCLRAPYQWFNFYDFWA